MSFLRHPEIFPSDGGARLTAYASAHRVDEFPADYSLAVCSPAWPASASPASRSVQSSCLAGNQNPVNGNPSLFSLSQPRGAVQTTLSPFHTPTTVVATTPVDRAVRPLFYFFSTGVVHPSPITSAESWQPV